MLIDIEQDNKSVHTSYVDENGKIAMKSFNVATHTENFGFYDYKICADTDPQKENKLQHFMGESIKKVPARRFDVEELREFLVKRIPQEDSNELHAFRSLQTFSCDIEINVSGMEDDIFPDPYKAEYEICTIQITAPDYSTITLTTDGDRINPETDDQYIADYLNDYFKSVGHIITNPIEYKTLTFSNERELLEFFWKKVYEVLHSTIWWNSNGFDIPYLSKRSTLNGINIGNYSPTGSAKTFNLRNASNDRIPWWPRHRYTEDYMDLVSHYGWDIWPRLSMALDWISKYLFGIGKVPYDGTFRDMYMGDYRKFLAYGAVDTILLQMIHQERNYISSIEAVAYYCKLPMQDTWKTTAMCHAVIWDDLYGDGKINAADYVRKEKTPYDGGYVKSPVTKFIQFPVCSDYAALYPRIMVSHGPSFESYIKKITSKEELLKYRSDAKYYVSVNGNLYHNDKDYAIRRVEQGLLDERGIYKKMYLDISTNLINLVEAEMAKRGMKIDNAKLA